MCTFLLASLVCEQASATDWCTGQPLPPKAELRAALKAKQLYRHDYWFRINPRHGGVQYWWDLNRQPTIVYCILDDDQQPPNHRHQQCVGLGSGGCLQGWVDRSIGRYYDEYFGLTIVNEHERDTRFVTLYSDAKLHGQLRLKGRGVKHRHTVRHHVRHGGKPR